ncbi:carbohydrate-binding module family 14 protein [Pontivivens ytuae]|uniref:Chitin-binding type-2 domain-containing protein n=1 Tax=Pontivivens ytuae TaxID=2789856 RepID=A0A7S9QCC8_9RHOB|nr:carbohydrate-binding module family 14 protein [Pontivivens ytuae]QPH52971.1 hypothetical protein I0K15_14300 [Pontivivens ytuae]
MKTLVLALAMTAAPLTAFAAGCNWGQEQVMSCAPGTTYDADTRTCVATTS